jgi:hypothetical protein
VATQAEIERAYQDTRARWARNELVSVGRIRAAYRRATQAIATQIATPGGGRGPVTRDLLAELEQQLAAVETALNLETMALLQRGIVATAREQAGASFRADSAIAPLYAAQPVQRLVQGAAEVEAAAWLTRVGNDGLQLSDRVWRVGRQYTDEIEHVLEEAIISGQSARDVSRELLARVAPIGGLRQTRPETQEGLGIQRFRQGAPLDWRALRLARTEINSAAREATVMTNRTNPFYRGVRWRRSNNLYPCHICDDLEQGGPAGDGFYPEPDEPTPAASHPNCMCVILPDYGDRQDVVDRLIAWGNDPTSQPELEQWYDDVRGAATAPPPEIIGQPPTVRYEDIGPGVRAAMEAQAAALQTELAATQAEYAVALHDYSDLIQRRDELGDEEYRARREVVWARRDALMQREAALRRQQRTAGREFVYADQPAQFGRSTFTSVRNVVQKALPPHVTQGLEELQRILGPNIVDGPPLEFRQMASNDPHYKSGRSYQGARWDPQTKSWGYRRNPQTGALEANWDGIALHPKDTRVSTTVHEATHWVEERAQLGAEIQAHIDSRTQGEPLITMNEAKNRQYGTKGKNYGYRPNEKTRPDRFLEPYMGKHYADPNAHEFLTMATQNLYDNPLEFARKDPESFDFTLQLLRRHNGSIPQRVLEAERARLAAPAAP